MHRMRHTVLALGLALLGVVALGPRASADLIDPNPAQTYPDLFGGNVNGKVTYKYDPATQTGNFTSVNLPFYIATGQDPKDGGPEELSVVPNADGVRRQVINLTLDKNGQLVTSATNSYELYGTVVLPAVTDKSGAVTTPAMTVSGLLLKATPTAFGSMSIPGSGLSTFDMKMNITGGSLADYFGKNAYVEITPKIGSTFTGSFTQDFEGSKVTSNTRGNFISPPPLPVPEPGTVVLFLAGGVGYFARRRLRRARG